jgi:hypothetical protein
VLLLLLLRLKLASQGLLARHTTDLLSVHKRNKVDWIVPRLMTDFAAILRVHVHLVPAVFAALPEIANHRIKHLQNKALNSPNRNVLWLTLSPAQYQFHLTALFDVALEQIHLQRVFRD